jgi:hypothetical protein
MVPLKGQDVVLAAEPPLQCPRFYFIFLNQRRRLIVLFVVINKTL